MYTIQGNTLASCARVLCVGDAGVLEGVGGRPFMNVAVIGELYKELLLALVKCVYDLWIEMTTCKNITCYSVGDCYNIVIILYF